MISRLLVLFCLMTDWQFHLSKMKMLQFLDYTFCVNYVFIIMIFA